MKTTRRNRGSIEDMINVFQDKIDELEGSDIHSSTDTKNKEYRYITKHGLGPGMMPKNVNLIRHEDLDDYRTAIYLDRPLSRREIDDYDIYPEWLTSSTEMYYEDDLDSTGYISDDIDELDYSVDDEYDLVTI